MMNLKQLPKHTPPLLHDDSLVILTTTVSCAKLHDVNKSHVKVGGCALRANILSVGKCTC